MSRYVTLCFMPSQPVQLYESEAMELVMMINDRLGLSLRSRCQNEGNTTAVYHTAAAILPVLLFLLLALLLPLLPLL